MVLRTIFDLEGNPLEFVQFEGDKLIPCVLCTKKIAEGVAIAHENGNKPVFCHSCFGFLQEGFDSIKEQQLSAHAKDNEEVTT